MITWDELLCYDMLCVTVNIHRSLEIQKKYEEDKGTPQQKLRLEKIKEDVEKTKYLLKENNFPYDISSNVDHYVFWFKGDYTLEQAKQICIREKCVSCSDIIIFVNDPSVKSVHKIGHYHIFIKKHCSNEVASIVKADTILSCTT